MRLIRIGAALAAATTGMLALLAAAAAGAQDGTGGEAQEKWYQVEVLVFERRGEEALEAESWDPDPGYPPIEESISLIVPGESPQEGPGPHAFRVLPEDALTLLKTRGHLDNSSQTAPILHVAWRQPGVPREDAQWVNLYLPPGDGRPARRSGDFLGMARRAAAQDRVETGEPALVPLDALQAPAVTPPVLDGTVRVHLSRYLHADVDLIYHRYGVDTPFRIQTTRRMRSGELHYLDHPVFGVLVKVVPLEMEKTN